MIPDFSIAEDKELFSLICMVDEISRFDCKVNEIATSFSRFGDNFLLMQVIKLFGKYNIIKFDKTNNARKNYILKEGVLSNADANDWIY